MRDRCELILALTSCFHSALHFCVFYTVSSVSAGHTQIGPFLSCHDRTRRWVLFPVLVETLPPDIMESCSFFIFFFIFNPNARRVFLTTVSLCHCKVLFLAIHLLLVFLLLCRRFLFSCRELAIQAPLSLYDQTTLYRSLTL